MQYIKHVQTCTCFIFCTVHVVVSVYDTFNANSNARAKLM